VTVTGKSFDIALNCENIRQNSLFKPIPVILLEGFELKKVDFDITDSTFDCVVDTD
jgi:hypothetical protein